MTDIKMCHWIGFLCNMIYNTLCILYGIIENDFMYIHIHIFNVLWKHYKGNTVDFSEVYVVVITLSWISKIQENVANLGI
jgi:hypothetical protein